MAAILAFVAGLILQLPSLHGCGSQLCMACRAYMGCCARSTSWGIVVIILVGIVTAIASRWRRCASRRRQRQCQWPSKPGPNTPH